MPVNLPLSKLGLGDDFKYEIIEGSPALLNRMLCTGELDLAPISSFEYLKNKDKYQILDGISISSKEAADSVLFFCNRDFWTKGKKVVHLTNKSATSVNLLKIILKEHYKLDDIEFKVFDTNENYDAKLLIGDEALKEDKRNYEEVIDLGTKWFEMTNLPMVFGLWTINKESKLYQNKGSFKFINQSFLELRDKGFDEFYPDMIIEAFKATGLSKDTLRQYFNNLDYKLLAEHKKSLDLFANYLAVVEYNCAR